MKKLFKTRIGIAVGIIIIFALGFTCAFFLTSGKKDAEASVRQKDTTEAATASEWTVKMLNFGTYKKDSKAGTAESITPYGRTVVVYNKSLLKQTTEVPGRLGVMFGFSYSVQGPDLSLKTMFKVIPPKLLTDPAGKSSSIFEYPKDSIVGVSNFDTWLFEGEWEIAEGTWTLELWNGERKLLSKEFFVKIPKETLSSNE